MTPPWKQLDCSRCFNVRSLRLLRLRRFRAEVQTEQVVIAFYDGSVGSNVHAINDVQVLTAHREQHDRRRSVGTAGELHKRAMEKTSCSVGGLRAAPPNSNHR